jgi:hypothetical protein
VVGYVAAVVAAAFAFGAHSYSDTCYDAYAGSMFVPLLGGLIGWGIQSECHPSRDRAPINGQPVWAVMGAASAGMQLLGAALLLGGSLSSIEVTVYDGEDRQLSLLPVGPEGAPGLQLRLRM